MVNKNPDIDFLMLRSELGLSQEKFARKIGVSARTTWRWEKGISRPNPLAVDKLNTLVKHSLNITLHEYRSKFRVG